MRFKNLPIISLQQIIQIISFRLIILVLNLLKNLLQEQIVAEEQLPVHISSINLPVMHSNKNQCLKQLQTFKECTLLQWQTKKTVSQRN
jgi:hypothetical protein